MDFLWFHYLTIFAPRGPEGTYLGEMTCLERASLPGGWGTESDEVGAQINASGAFGAQASKTLKMFQTLEAFKALKTS